MNETESSSYQTELDTEIKNYLAIYQASFDMPSAASWGKYIYLMIDELLRNELQETDVLRIKQKYAEFRCDIKTNSDKKQRIFNKIITSYTNKINSICEACEEDGILCSINDWQHRLCVQHFLEYKKLDLNKEVLEELSWFGKTYSTEQDKSYRNILNSKYDTLNDSYAARDIAIIHLALKEGQVKDSIIREVLVEFFVGDKNYYVIDGVGYTKKTFFEDEEGNQIHPSPNFYNNEDYLLSIIDGYTDDQN